MKNKIIINYYTMFLGLIIFFNLQGFYLFSSSSFTDSISLILEITFFVFVMFSGNNTTIQKSDILFIMPIVFVFTSSIMANFDYLQPLWMGIIAQRSWVMSILMFFPIKKIIGTKKVNSNDIYKLLDKLNIVYIFLIFIQYFIGDHVTILHVLTKERYDKIRIYVTISFIMISYFVHLVRIIERKKINFKSIFFIIIPILIQFLITKSRMAVLALILVTIILILTSQRNYRKYSLLGVATLGIVISLFTTIGKEILSLITGNNINITDDTSQIREIGREFFLRQINIDWIHKVFGAGYVNINWGQSFFMSQYDKGIYPADNGIFGILFYYGYFFLIFLIIIYVLILIKAWERHKEVFYFLLLGILGIFSLYPDIYMNNIAFSLVCAIVYEKREKITFERIK